TTGDPAAAGAAITVRWHSRACGHWREHGRHDGERFALQRVNPDRPFAGGRSGAVDPRAGQAPEGMDEARVTEARLTKVTRVFAKVRDVFGETSGDWSQTQKSRRPLRPTRPAFESDTCRSGERRQISPQQSSGITWKPGSANLGAGWLMAAGCSHAAKNPIHVELTTFPLLMA